ncbi:hypothetical protein HBA55_34590 [Pseudomaricurvus alkylphenolicus]|uniref:hypothetical protein n=1 Tax=Pseudomaricurvus alkylphenolicus TaxID=1306991 RepID=UPI00141DB590|nr:hypothetical protein [Pseudomaricurvus alkylphenolicus]NIB44760.1 hypothetical protein [Pseudomaricurvus alkylphenolicus]
MILEVYTKNFARASVIELPDNPVPRVGESIILEQDAGYLQGTTELLITDVSYILKDDTLTPHVQCIARNGAHHRRDLLEENGWI